MEFKFNSLDEIKQPLVSIHRLDLGMLGYLNVNNLVIKPTFCSLDEVTFTCYKDSNFYDCLKKDMVLEIEGFGRFVITNVSQDGDGQTESRAVTANSYEETMNKVTLSYKDNTVFKLWDVINPDKGIELNENNIVVDAENAGVYTIKYKYPTLLYIISQQTGWTIAHVDSTLLNEYRTMTIDKAQAYGLLMGDIAEAFKCYFEFDTMERKIYCYDRNRNVSNTGINLSYRNLINKQTISEGSDEVITALTIEGAEGVGINLVNPLGNNTVYDFSYYMNDEDWGMPSALQTKVRAWMSKVNQAKTTYATYVQVARELSVQGVQLDTDLAEAKAAYNTWLDKQAIYISANDNDKLEEIYDDVIAAEDAVKDCEDAIKEHKDLVDYNNKRKSDLIKTLNMDANFTSDELKQLSFYINGAVYENENFIYTTVMSEEDKIKISQQLYDQGMIEFAKFSRGQYQYTCEISPFMFNKDYEEFTKNLVLGNYVNLEIEDGEWVTPKLVQIVIDYDNPSNTTCVLSDSFKLQNGAYEFADSYTQTVKASRKTSLSASKWDEPCENGFYSTVSQYITNALNLANQEIVNADNQEFTLGSYGLRGKMALENGGYDDHQVAMTNNVLAFTDDNWNSCSTALGKVKIGEGEDAPEYYGLVAEAVFGRLVAGEQLVIQSKNAEFKMDDSGVSLTNAPMTITKGNSKIVLNPTDGFQIQKLRDGTTDKYDILLSEDADGNIKANSIDIETGYIGGWTIEKNGLTSPTGDYIKSDGSGKLGLLTYYGKTATFDGNIYANNLYSNSSSGQNIFVNGTMLGDWLTDGSVGIGKRDSEWDSLYAKKAKVDELEADMITTDILAAGQIVAGQITTPLMFGGKFRVCDPLNPDNDYAIIECLKNDYIDSQHPSVRSLHETATGHIYLNSKYGSVIVGEKNADGTYNRKNLTSGGINTYTLNVLGADGVDCALDVSATARVSWLRCSNRVDTQDLQVFNKSVFKNDITTEGRAWINGGTAVTYTEGGSSYFGHGVDADIPVGDKTLKVRSGIIIAYW